MNNETTLEAKLCSSSLKIEQCRQWLLNLLGKIVYLSLLHSNFCSPSRLKLCSNIFRQQCSKRHCWRKMLLHNFTTGDSLRTRESNFELIEPLIETANNQNPALLQEEHLDMRKSLPPTAAGRELFGDGKLQTLSD